jgi:Zn-dependent protease
MKWSITLGKIIGVKILLHWTFWILILWIVFSQVLKGGAFNDILFSVGSLLSVFACVVLHEFGHILVAKKYGIQTRRIVLLPIGGVADLERLPENPKQELLIAIAGPLVNIAIAGLIFLTTPINKVFFQEPDLLQLTKYQLFWSTLFSINVLLAIFNLIPAFPMDGGRVLRAILAMYMNRIRATRIAANLGQFIAILFIFFGLFINPFLSLIGIFIFFGAYSENFMIQHQEFLRRFLVRDAMMTSFTRLSASTTIKEVSDKIIEGPEHDFIVSENGHVSGIVTYPVLIQALKERSLDTHVSEIMIKNFDSTNINDSLDLIFMKVQRDKSSFLPVLDGHNLAGVINIGNINEFLTIRTSHS